MRRTPTPLSFGTANCEQSIRTTNNRFPWFVCSQSYFFFLFRIDALFPLARVVYCVTPLVTREYNTRISEKHTGIRATKKRVVLLYFVSISFNFYFRTVALPLARACVDSNLNRINLNKYVNKLR